MGRVVKRDTYNGRSAHPLYPIWANMLTRCRNPKATAYRHYGGRGITVFPKWKRFLEFYQWAVLNGWKKGLSLERVDCNQDYHPDNCTFIEKKAQPKNTRSNIHWEAFGKKQIQADWARECGISREAVLYRLKKGWDIERALSTPPNVLVREDNIWIEAFGEKRLLIHWAKARKLSETTLRNRMRKGWKPERALSTPSRKWKRKS